MIILKFSWNRIWHFLRHFSASVKQILKGITLESNKQSQNWKQLKCQVFCARLASFNQSGLVSDTHIFLLNSQNRLNDIYATSHQRRCNVMTLMQRHIMTLHRRWFDVALATCAHWEETTVTGDVLPTKYVNKNVITLSSADYPHAFLKNR